MNTILLIICATAALTPLHHHRTPDVDPVSEPWRWAAGYGVWHLMELLWTMGVVCLLLTMTGTDVPWGAAAASLAIWTATETAGSIWLARRIARRELRSRAAMRASEERWEQQEHAERLRAGDSCECQDLAGLGCSPGGA